MNCLKGKDHYDVAAEAKTTESEVVVLAEFNIQLYALKMELIYSPSNGLIEDHCFFLYMDLLVNSSNYKV